MCGIAGILNSDLPPGVVRRRLEHLQAALRHRGPDDCGSYCSPTGRTGLAQTRLAILDLSAAGHQPMASADGRYHIVFNGEIYNYRELRRELAGAGETFGTDTDTEVILKMYRRHGADCVHEFAGMFAFAIWDEAEQTCFLARDPFGIKPLYYHQTGDGLVFASELQALLRADLIPRRLAASALRGYFLFGSVQEPETLLEGTHCLPAGSWLLWTRNGTRQRRFWEPTFYPDGGDVAAAVATTRAALVESVGRHFVSDVPVGIFLSGGVDSTALVALARAAGVERLKTVSISLDDPRFNEGGPARRTAEFFATEHHDWRLTGSAGRGLMAEFLTHQDQPSIDGFNTFCVARQAHNQGLKVVLSGLGGDELFAGYRSFATVPRLARTGQWLRLGGPAPAALGHWFERHGWQPRLRRLGSFLGGASSLSAAYWTTRGIFTPAEAAQLERRYVPGAAAEGAAAGWQFALPAQPTTADQVSYLELTRYMRNQLLRDSDVMSMASGLELRVPFVDARLFESVARIPSGVRLAPGKKLLLAAVPEIPEWVRSAPKRGFLFPYENWLAEEWHDIFARIAAASPVPLQSWYRSWALFMLEQFVAAHKLETPGLVGADTPRR